MADFPANFAPQAPVVSIAGPNGLIDRAVSGGAAPPPPPAVVIYDQMIRDTVAGVCRYSLPTLTATPLPAETTPPHTGALVPDTWTLVSEREQ